jgi:hypothetical protein
MSNVFPFFLKAGGNLLVGPVFSEKRVHAQVSIYLP